MYTQEDRPCKRCSTAGKSCGPKTLARENEAISRTQAESHKPQPTRSHPWSASKPLLPRILELVGPEMVSEVASKLASELVILHEKVQANPFFRPPSEASRDFIPRLPEIIVDVVGNSNFHHHHQPQLPSPGQLLSPLQQQQRNSRAVSLPPNPELIHNRPNEYPVESQDEKKPFVELPRIKIETRHDSYPSERRSLADGVPQFQPFWYLPPPHISYSNLLTWGGFIVVNVQ